MMEHIVCFSSCFEEIEVLAVLKKMIQKCQLCFEDVDCCFLVAEKVYSSVGLVHSSTAFDAPFLDCSLYYALKEE